MKQRKVVKILKKNGYSLCREGSNHEIYEKDGIRIAVPRHKEIRENTAKAILKEAGIE